MHSRIIHMSLCFCLFNAGTRSWYTHVWLVTPVVSWHPTTDYHNALKKYGYNPKPIVTGPISNGTGSVVANPTRLDREYRAPVIVGKNTLLLNFDTTHDELWVFTKGTEGLGAHNVYDTRTGNQLTGYTWSLNYGDGGNVRGLVYKDKVEVGGAVVFGQTVEAAQYASPSVTYNMEGDGALGLALSSNNQIHPIPQNNFFENVKGSLKEPLFAVSLKHHRPGEIDFTSVNTDRGLWQFMTDEYCVRDCGDFARGMGFSAVLDSAISLIIVNHEVVTNYYSFIPDAHFSGAVGGIVFPCNIDPPDLIIKIGNYAATVSGEYIKYAELGDGYCFGGIQSDNGYGINILGSIFFKGSYIVFANDKKPLLGFAAQA
uniref:Aspartic protease pep1 n=1 Tax=Talaromyces marneffei PM1 TaxID=1077442 RepID=A0A093V2S5_TALMA